MADARCWLNNPNLANKEQWLKADYIRRSDLQVINDYNPNIGGTVSMSPVEWAAQEKAKQDISDYKKRYQEQLDCLYRLIAETRSKAAKVQGEDPDGPLVSMKPAHPLPERTISAPQHDFIAALYRPYNPVV